MFILKYSRGLIDCEGPGTIHSHMHKVKDRCHCGAQITSVVSTTLYDHFMASRTALFNHLHRRVFLPGCSLLSSAPPGLVTLHLPQYCSLSTPADATSFAHTPYALVQTTELMLDSVHQYTHLPWWVVVVGSTLILRGAVTLPLAIYQAKMTTKQELLLPRLKELQESVLHSVVVKCRRANKSHTEANKMFKKEVC